MQVLLTAEPNIMHYDALWHFWYTLYFYCNFFICLVFSMFLYIQTHFKLFNSATRTVSILISLKIQNISASFSSMSFPTCLLSKSTNRVVILRNSFSGLYWMQFTGSLIFLLLGLCPCVGVSREKVRGRYICWDRACLKMFFSPSCLLFGYVANLDKKKISFRILRVFLQCLQASSVVIDKSEAILMDNPMCLTPTHGVLKFHKWCALVWIFFICFAELLKDTLNLKSQVFQ